MDNMEIRFSMPTDANGYIGKECPQCSKYFKIKPGTGVPNITISYCPYCGVDQKGEFADYITHDQSEYIKSHAVKAVADTIFGGLKGLSSKPSRNQMVSMGIEIKRNPIPIKHYSEKELEKHITCDSCSLEYAIYGVYGYCPDCATHNSLQIFQANLDTAIQVMKLADGQPKDIYERAIENGIEDIISIFDAFGKECLKQKNHSISFQNIMNAEERCNRLLSLRIFRTTSPEDKNYIIEQFQIRHTIAHNEGVVDELFLQKIPYSNQRVGQKVSIKADDIERLVTLLFPVAREIYEATIVSTEKD